MATKNKGVKKLPGKKPAAKKTARKEQPPVRVIVEVVVRNETAGTASSFKTGQLELTQPGKSHMAALEKQENFSYEFTGSGVTVNELVINFDKKTNPGEKGKMFANVFTNTVLVQVDANLESPAGTGALTLFFLNKKILDNITFAFTPGGGGGLNLPVVPL